MSLFIPSFFSCTMVSPLQSIHRPTKAKTGGKEYIIKHYVETIFALCWGNKDCLLKTIQKQFCEFSEGNTLRKGFISPITPPPQKKCKTTSTQNIHTYIISCQMSRGPWQESVGSTDRSITLCP